MGESDDRPGCRCGRADRRTAHRRRPRNTAPETFTPYDSAEYLTSSEDVAAHLEAAVEEASDDPALVAHALGVIARSRNLSELARRVGMSREGLYKALSSEGNPSFATIMKVATALGLRIHLDSAA